MMSTLRPNRATQVHVVHQSSVKDDLLAELRVVRPLVLKASTPSQQLKRSLALDNNHSDGQVLKVHRTSSEINEKFDSETPCLVKGYSAMVPSISFDIDSNSTNAVDANNTTKYKTENVVWRETKVSNNRWLLNVKGQMVLHKDDGQPPSTDPCGTFVLVGDQIATKLGRQDYEVDMIATKFNVSSDSNSEAASVEKKKHLLGYLKAHLERKEQVLKNKRHLGAKQDSCSGDQLPDIATLLNRESEEMLQGARGLQGNSHAQGPSSISTLKFFTEKGKTMNAFSRTKPVKPITFGPKVGTQYHWFFVAEMKIKKSDDQNSTNETYNFEITSNKFQYSFGRPLSEEKLAAAIAAKRSVTDIRKFFLPQNKESEVKIENVPVQQVKQETKEHESILGQGFYLCKRHPISKSKFIGQVLDDLRTDVKDQARLDAAEEHRNQTKADKIHYNSPKTFVDVDGKSHRYTGMPVGGFHNWFYRDAEMEDTMLPKSK